MSTKEDFDVQEDCDDLNSTLTEESQPLSDDLNDLGDSKSRYSYGKIRRDELLVRLTRAEKKIEQSEESINEIFHKSCKIQDISIDSYQGRPKDIKDDAKCVVTYIQEHIKKLEEQFHDLDNADIQIDKITERVLQNIDDTYDYLTSVILQEINKKRDLVRLEAQVFKSESLAPLKACRKEIKSQISLKKQSILKIQKILQDSQASNTEIYELLNINRNTGGIPAVPLAEELPYLSFKSPPTSSLNDVLDKIHNLGCVLRLGPVEIVNIEEKPASIFVKWDITDPEYSEEHNYILQKAVGEIHDPTADNFETVYEGPETCCFIRELSINQPITLRVGIQSLDSAWSAPRVTKTQVPNYRWSEDNKNYIVTNSCRIATKVSDSPSAILSRAAQLDANQIIEFEFLDVPKGGGTDDEGIALVVDPVGIDENFKRPGTLMITALGKIIMDGNEKLMQLPQMYVRTKIIFTILRKSSESLRINIECQDKAVTYDWSVLTPLYFAGRFIGKWSLMVK